MTQGENFVNLKGTILYPDFKRVGQKNLSLFKAKLKIPVGDDGNKAHYVKIAAWRENADALKTIGENQWIHIHGHIEDRVYDGKCKTCNATEKKYWTEVVVDNFAPISE